jgi:hypothetical protein
VDVATLGLRVVRTDVQNATTDLGRFGDAAVSAEKKTAVFAEGGTRGFGKIERAVEGLALEAAQMENGFGRLGGAALQFGVGGEVTVAFLAGFAAMRLVMDYFNAEAEETAERLRAVYAEADKLRRADFADEIVKRLTAQTALNAAVKEFARLNNGDFTAWEKLTLTPTTLERELKAAAEAVNRAEEALSAFADDIATKDADAVADLTMTFKGLNLVLGLTAKSIQEIRAGAVASLIGSSLGGSGLLNLGGGGDIHHGLPLPKGDIIQQSHDLTEAIRQDWYAAFDDIAHHGVRSFEQFFAVTLSGFLKLLQDMDRQKAASEFAGEGALLGKGGAGAAAGPAVALVAVFGVLSKAMNDAADAAERAAAEAEAASHAWILTARSQHLLVDTAPGLQRALGELDLEFRRLVDQAHQTYLNNPKAEEAALRDLYEVQLKREDQLREEYALTQKIAREDLDVRALRAQGNDAGADDLAFKQAQEREMAAADEAIKARLAEVQAMEAQKREIDKQIDARQREADAIRDALAQTTRTVSTLRDFAQQLRVQTASPLGSVELARKEFDRLAALAAHGDQDAASKLPQFGQQFLDYSRQYNASGSGYQGDLQHVLQTIDGLGDHYDVQRNLEQMQLDALNAILNEIKGLNVNIRDRFPWSQGGFTLTGGGTGGIIPPAPGAVLAVQQAGFQGVIGELQTVNDRLASLENRIRMNGELSAVRQ